MRVDGVHQSEFALKSGLVIIWDKKVHRRAVVADELDQASYCVDGVADKGQWMKSSFGSIMQVKYLFEFFRIQL